MKQITLNKLTLTDFKACSGTYEFGKTNNVFARNKGGKTRLHNAWLWLLTGSDNEDRTNFELFDTSKEITKENALPSIVEAEIEIDGVKCLLKRQAVQGWVKSRGETEYKRSGSDKYSYYVDDIEYSASDYNKCVEESIAPIGKIKIIANVVYFLSLDWKTQRAEFSEIVGDIDNSEYSEDYSDILKLLAVTDAENIKTDLRKKISILKDAIKTSYDRVVLLTEELPNISDVQEAKDKKEEDNKEIIRLDKELEGLTSSIQPYIEKRNKELAEIDSLKREYANKKRDFENVQNANVDSMKAKLACAVSYNDNVDAENMIADRNRSSMLAKRTSLEKELEDAKKQRENLLSERDKTKSLVFDKTNCPYCGAELPADKIEEARTSFNNNKTNELEYIVKRGKATKKRIDELEAEITSISSELEKPIEHNEKRDVEELKNQIKEMQLDQAKFEETKTSSDMLADIKLKEESLTTIPTVDSSSLTEQKKSIQEDIEKQIEIITKEKTYNDYQQKIADEKLSSKKNGIEQAEKERIISRIDKYLSEKADIIRNRVNKYFKRCHVEMTTFNKSGCEVPCCDIITDGRKSQVFNTAERTLTGLDISQAFIKFYEVSIPLFIDNIDGLSSDSRGLINSEAQMIYLCVSDDEKLRIEKD